MTKKYKICKKTGFRNLKCLCQIKVMRSVFFGENRVRRPYLGLIKYHLSEVSANKTILSEIRLDSEVEHRLAIFAVKNGRFKREEYQ